MSKVCVIGATSFSGGHFVKHLVAKGFKVSTASLRDAGTWNAFNA